MKYTGHVQTPLLVPYGNIFSFGCSNIKADEIHLGPFYDTFG